MPTLPAGIATVTVTGTLLHADGSLAVGSVRFVPSVSVLYVGPNAVTLPSRIDSQLVAGVLTVVLPATDDTAGNPTGWTYKVEERVRGGRSFSMALPAAPATQDYTDLVPVPANDGTPVVVGPTGATGSTGPTGATGAASTVPGPTGPAGPATTDASLLASGTVADARLTARLQATALSAAFDRRGIPVLYPEDYAGSNDQAKINAAVAAAMVLYAAGTTHVVIQFQSREYVLPDPATHPTGAGGAFAQLPLPQIATTAPRLALEFRGTAATILTTHPDQAVVQKSGTILRSTATGGWDAAYGLASVIGGPALNTPGAWWSNVCIVLDGLTIRRPDDASIAGADLTWCAQAKTRNLTLDTNVPLANITLATRTCNIGLNMPTVGNYALSTSTGDLFIFGSYAAVRYNEHYTCEHIVAYKNRIALAPAAAVHGSIIQHANLEWQNYAIADVSVGSETGPVPVGLSYQHFGMLDIEDGALGPFASVAHVLDTNNVLRATGRYVRVAAGFGAVSGPLTITGGLGVTLEDLTVDVSWIGITLLSDWINFGGTAATAQYRKGRDGYVELRGDIKSGTLGAPAFQLPLGYRAQADLPFSVAVQTVGGVGTGIVIMDSNGAGWIGTNSTVQVSLNGVRYPADH